MGDAGAATVLTGRLMERRDVAERTTAFRFSKPPGFTFTAGQFLEVTLRSPRETDAEGNTRAFSIASAPHEEGLMVATRMRDTAFKRNLAAMALGTEVTLAGPFGDLVLHEDASRPALILAGGIGVTPFRSIVSDAGHRKLPHRIVLFSANRRPQDAPFLEELRALERQNPKFRLVATATDEDPSLADWKGERGRIDAAMIARHASDAPRAIHYVAGPPGMVRGLQTMLRASGVDATNIRTEEFDGY
ncbi:MAG: FAD-dependent oxidoreductase [Thermoplasmata archaeon]|nr:FAD-dependent oxidoreductase [Thermoplasmata archaeon]